MTQPETLPLAKCPNKECGNPCETDEFDSLHWVWCRACKYCGPGTTLGEAEAIRLHNLIARPQQSAEPVAYRNPETGHVCSREKWESMGSSFRQGMRQPLYAAPEVKENDD